ncbi:BTB/POZ domain-containing protein [Ophiocordyceps camponoti-floridani]|uniref:BTB/POZ domain-containing protein n=1 Tax=Ophiocordyceps camponoti-floridani TaxID=2030778 RepID=A0A8H4Q3V5_9HYPO|nr:BTB/POZ domain-containing protein [Ophiocordyceps camponoti-floridani]
MASTSPSDAHDLTPAGPHQTLPPNHLFAIQVGHQMFKLSGASLSSDSPSYFTRHFSQATDVHRPLYIDRDPDTFRDMELHLQGYHVSARDGTHLVRLLSDARFYSLAKLTSQLYEADVFVSVGGREFRLSRRLLTSPTNSPNFFSLFISGVDRGRDNDGDGDGGDDDDDDDDDDDGGGGGTGADMVMPGPSLPNRSAETFAELVRLLCGYRPRQWDETLRRDLLQDARYFGFKGVEQMLIPHALSYNPVLVRHEICILLDNVQKSGVSISPQAQQHQGETIAWVQYARPLIDDAPADLIVEMGSDSTRLLWGSDGPRADFSGETRARVAKLLSVLAGKMSLPPTTQPLGLLMASGGASSQPPTPGNTPLSADLVRVSMTRDTAVVLDGTCLVVGGETGGDDEGGSRKRRRVTRGGRFGS